MSSRGDGTHARRHDLGHIASVLYAPVLMCEFLQSFSLLYLNSFNHSLSLQSNGVLKLVSRSSLFLRRFFPRPSRRKGLGQNWSHSIPSTGIATVLSQLQQPSDTKKKSVDVSPSPLFYLNGLQFYLCSLTSPVHLFRNGRR